MSVPSSARLPGGATPGPRGEVGAPGASGVPGPDGRLSGDGGGVVASPAVLLAERAAATPSEVALRAKRRGLWNETTWAEYARRAARIGLGLRESGLAAGDRVAIVGGNSVAWLASDLGAQGAGLVTVIADPLGPLGDEERLLADSSAAVAVVDDEEQLDRVRAVEGALPALRLVVVVDTTGIRRLGDGAIALEELEDLAPAAGATARWEALARSVEPSADATVVPSLGTTGPPKAAVLTHANLAASARAAAEALGIGAGDEILSALPLCFTTERVISQWAPLRSGAVVNFGEGAATLLEEMRQVQPTVLLGVPHLWGRIEGDVRARAAGAGPLKRAVLGYLRRRGPSLAGSRARGRRGSAGAPLAWFVGGRALGRQTGTGRMRVALSTGAWLAPAVREAMEALGVAVRQLYGQVETSGITSVATVDDARPDSVGPPVPGVDVRLGAGGEIEVAGATVFSGYLGDRPEGPRPVGGPDGWWPTGDLGTSLEGGSLAITGRVRDLITTAGGVAVHPARIEKMVEASPLVREAVVVGHDRPHLAALISLDEPALSAWAARRDNPVTTFRELIDDPDVRALVQEWIDDVNGRLASPERIRAFALLPGQMAGDYGELTSINEIRRRAVLDRCADRVEDLYRA